MQAVACGVIGMAAVAASFFSKGDKALGFGIIAVVALMGVANS
ncbi:hypothetical protein [Shinella sp. H4-D48]|nr:hypothetical protein [Shinella sp. H4-D48]